jgi:hypothetical protein
VSAPREYLRLGIHSLTLPVRCRCCFMSRSHVSVCPCYCVKS